MKMGRNIILSQEDCGALYTTYSHFHNCRGSKSAKQVSEYVRSQQEDDASVNSRLPMDLRPSGVRAQMWDSDTNTVDSQSPIIKIGG